MCEENLVPGLGRDCGVNWGRHDENSGVNVCGGMNFG